MIRYFTFGQGQAHHIYGTTFDPDLVIKIESEDPRKEMVAMFGQKWSMEYDEMPDMDYYPRGIYDLSTQSIEGHK